MACMTSFCRITGHARNLPKPCYFPLLPPISPAVARRLCRITANVAEHSYTPIIAFGKHYAFDGLEGCKITRHEDFNFMKPVFEQYKDNEKSFASFTELITKMKTKLKKKVDTSRFYVYKLSEPDVGVVLPPELEEAIKTGEVESLTFSKDVSHMNVKIKQGRFVKLKVETIPKEDVNSSDNYYYGEGQSNETLKKQQKVLNERNLRKQETMAKKKAFEDRDNKADEDEHREAEQRIPKRPVVKFDPEKRKLKKEKMEKMLQEQKENKSIILPKYDEASVSVVNPDEQLQYEKMLEDLMEAQKKSFNVTTVFMTNFDWTDLDKPDTAGFDWSSYYNEDDIIDPVCVTTTEIEEEYLASIPNVQSLDIVASVEPLEPPPAIEVSVLQAIYDIQGSKLKTTENVIEKLRSMKCDNLYPTFNEIQKIISNRDKLVPGYLVEKEDGSGAEFVKKEDYVPGKEVAICGAMSTAVDNTERFVSGQIIHLAEQESFVAGQSIETPQGKRFVPGQTIVNNLGLVSFIPGQCVSTEQGNTFVAGHIIDSTNPKFIPGQVVDRGDNKPIFMPGQTISTENGPKFVPGDFTVDEDGDQEFVPGIKIFTSKGETFVPGQAFQSEGNITFTPGQIINTEEGPSFVPGKSFESEGKMKFVKGDVVMAEGGKVQFEMKKEAGNEPEVIAEVKNDLVIPNEDLQLIAVAEKSVTGFIVKPANTSDIQAGERLYGDIVETESSVLFYIQGKLSMEMAADSKIISGELVVDETLQRFIPGKMISSPEGEKFIPGQLVRTNHGEEFVPGQIVETCEGPKFVPGQLVSTSAGEKFIPGQVIVEEEGPKFVPGQIIQTKNGATFIPGQMMNTEEGEKFVPGQLVETKDGPRFVPGQVIETSEGPKFVPGTVIETEEGLKYVPNNANRINNMEESEEDSEISFQGFDISPEELQLISSKVSGTTPHTPITKEPGLIDSDTLKKMADTMVIHGRTPEPYADKKKKKKKRAKITIDALDEEEEKEDVEKEDPATNKLDVLKHLMQAEKTLSTIRREKELRKINEIIGIDEVEVTHAAAIEAVKYIIANSEKEKHIIDTFIGDDEQLIDEVIKSIGNLENIERNDQVKKLVSNSLKAIVTKRCDKQVDELITKISENPESLFTDPRAQLLLTEAVGIVCVTGDVEVASLLDKFISEPSNPNCLKEDKDVLAVLQQLLVLHKIAERDLEVEGVLLELQNDPEGVKDRNKVRKLIRQAKSFLKKDKVPDKPFDIRHVASSKDIPTEIFEQLREDKEEAEKFMDKLPDQLFRAIMGDERCGGKLLETMDSEIAAKTSKDLQKFKKGMAIVVTKENMQAVIPRHYARSVYYGIMPYVLIDEEGFKFFERGLTGRKLAPARVIENTWFQPDSYYQKSVLYPQRVTASGMEYKLVLLGNSYRMNAPSLQYTSLVPSSGPTRISSLESQRRASRDGSITPLRRLSGTLTPTRRVSSSNLYDYHRRGSDTYSRNNSLLSGPYAVSQGMVPMESTFERPDSKLKVNEYSTAVTPYIPNDDDDLLPVKRSNTLEKLLDKYSSMSASKEYDNYNPGGTYSSCRNRTQPSVLEDDDDEYSYPTENPKYQPSSGLLSRSSITPDKSEESKYRYSHDRLKDIDYDDIPSKGLRSIQRPFSDIFEVDDEIDSPTNENTSFLRNSLIETAKKNYEALDFDFDEKPKVRSRFLRSKIHDDNLQNNFEEQPVKKVSKAKPNDYSLNNGNDDNANKSYSERLREWKNKQNQQSSMSKYDAKDEENDDDDDDSYLSPKKYQPKKYGSILSDDGDEDVTISPYISTRKSLDSTSRFNRYGISGTENHELDDITSAEPIHRGQDLQRFSQGRDAGRVNKSFVSPIRDLEGSLPPRKHRMYGGSFTSTIPGSIDDAQINQRSSDYDLAQRGQPYIDATNGLHGSKVAYDPSYGYEDGYKPRYGYSTGYGSGYGYQGGYGSGYGHQGGYPNTHDISGDSFSQRRPYGEVPSRYGSGGYGLPYGNQHLHSTGTYIPKTNYGTTPSKYGSYANYGEDLKSNMLPGRPSFVSPRRRFTSPLLLKDDDDEDGDITSYDPKREQRQLASKIARKYVFDSEDEE